MSINEYLESTLQIKQNTIFNKQITTYLDANYYQIDLKRLSNNSRIARFINSDGMCIFYWKGAELVMYEKGLCLDKNLPLYGYEYTRYIEKGASYSNYTLELVNNNNRIKSTFILNKNNMIGKIYNPEYVEKHKCTLTDNFYFEPVYFLELAEYVDGETLESINYNKENINKLSA